MNDFSKITSATLIAADKVTGTDVYNTDGERIGEVDDIMIDKITGRAIYAVMSFGGFLGLGEKYHPLPWSTLKYDTRLNGYVVALDKSYLEQAPSYEKSDSFDWTPAYGRSVDDYYKIPTVW